MKPQKASPGFWFLCKHFSYLLQNKSFSLRYCKFAHLVCLLCLLNSLLTGVHIYLYSTIELTTFSSTIICYRISRTLAFNTLNLSGFYTTRKEITINTLSTTDRQRLVNTIVTRIIGMTNDGNIEVSIIIKHLRELCQRVFGTLTEFGLVGGKKNS